MKSIDQRTVTNNNTTILYTQGTSAFKERSAEGNKRQHELRYLISNILANVHGFIGNDKKYIIAERKR